MEFLKFFLQAGLVGKIVLMVLILMSLFSWYFIFYNFFTLRKVRESLKAWQEFLDNTSDFSSMLKEIKTQGEDPIALRLRKATIRFGEIYNFYKEKLREEKAIIITEAERELDEITEIERERGLLAYGKGLGFLASTANTAPFIGLLGTVWGIMRSFHEIGLKGSASLATVAPGIAEALINTAMGLFVAIPASLSYNYFLLKKSSLSQEWELLFRRFKIISKREFLK